VPSRGIEPYTPEQQKSFVKRALGCLLTTWIAQKREARSDEDKQKTGLWEILGKRLACKSRLRRGLASAYGRIVWHEAFAEVQATHFLDASGLCRC
jgi:hypothetical protein